MDVASSNLHKKSNCNTRHGDNRTPQLLSPPPFYHCQLFPWDNRPVGREKIRQVLIRDKETAASLFLERIEAISNKTVSRVLIEFQ
jgi:hypothetical protein